jgi:hypothetical protein
VKIYNPKLQAAMNVPYVTLRRMYLKFLVGILSAAFKNIRDFFEPKKI